MDKSVSAPQVLIITPDSQINYNLLDKKCKKLVYECDKLNIKIPDHITHLTFGNFFNSPITNLPVGLEYLILGKLFNCSLDFLPTNLISITFVPFVALVAYLLDHIQLPLV